MAGRSCSCPCQEVWCGLQDVESFKNRFDEFRHSPWAALVPGAGGWWLVAVHWTSLRRRRGWSYEVLMLSRSRVWSIVAGRYSIPGPSYTAPCTIGHRTYLSKYRLSQHQKWFSSYCKDIDIFNPNEMISPWRWDDEEKSVLSVSMPVVWIY